MDSFNHINNLDSNERKQSYRETNPEAMIAYELQQQNKLLFCINDNLRNINRRW